MAGNLRNPAALPPVPERDNVRDPQGLDSGRFDQGDRYHSIRRKGSATWLLFFTSGGRGFFRGRDGGVGFARVGDVHLYASRAWQEYGTAPRERWAFDWCHFAPRPAWGEWLKLPPVAGVPGLAGVHVVHPALRARITGVFRELHRDVRLTGLWRHELAMNALERVLLACWEGLRTVRGRPPDPRVQAAQEWIAGHPAEPVTVADLAQQAHLSPSRFAHLFRHETGQSVIDCVLHTRLREAAKLLEQTPSPIKEIAYACGFGSPFYFSAQFRKRYGSSPRAWRARPSPRGR